MNHQNNQKGKESVEHAAKIRALEYDISKSLSRIDDLNRILDQKSHDLRSKESNLKDSENELQKLKVQHQSYSKELDHLRALEDRYRNENTDLQRRIDSEAQRNAELSANIKDTE